MSSNLSTAGEIFEFYYCYFTLGSTSQHRYIATMCFYHDCIYQSISSDPH